MGTRCRSFVSISALQRQLLSLHVSNDEYKEIAGLPDRRERRKELRAMFAQRAESEDTVARILRAERPRDIMEDSDDEPLYIPGFGTGTQWV